MRRLRHSGAPVVAHSGRRAGGLDTAEDRRRRRPGRAALAGDKELPMAPEVAPGTPEEPDAGRRASSRTRWRSELLGSSLRKEIGSLKTLLRLKVGTLDEKMGAKKMEDRVTQSWISVGERVSHAREDPVSEIRVADARTEGLMGARTVERVRRLRETRSYETE